MLIVTALGGNALLRRGEAMTAENQRRNVQIAAKSLAPVAKDHDLVVGHGNGPQVGLLALQGAAYTKVETYPLDVLGAQTEGMIGYMIEQELGNLMPFERPFATLLTMIEVDAKDPAFKNPTKFIGPEYDKADADAVYVDWGKPTQKAIRRATPDALGAMSFAAGSMGPKVDAACRFVRATGKRAAIGDLSDLSRIIAGDAGTTITPQASGVEYAAAR